MTATILNFFIWILKDFYGPIFFPIVGYSIIAILIISLLTSILLAEDWRDIERGFFIGFGGSIIVLFLPISILIITITLIILAIKKVWVLYKNRNNDSPVDLEF